MAERDNFLRNETNLDLPRPNQVKARLISIRSRPNRPKRDQFGQAQNKSISRD